MSSPVLTAAKSTYTERAPLPSMPAYDPQSLGQFTLSVSHQTHLDTGQMIDQLRTNNNLLGTEVRRLTDLVITTQIERDEARTDHGDELKARRNYEHASITDPLTTLYNRRALPEKFSSHQKWAFVFMADIDKFKLVNDVLGHAVGDTLLDRIGIAICRSVRDEDTDVVARLGGDEFMGLIAWSQIGKNPGLEKLTRAITGRMRKNVHSSFKKLQEELLISPDFMDDEKRLSDVEETFSKLDISIGTAPYRHGVTLHELTEKADAAMYAIKQERRRLQDEDPAQIALFDM
jgi:diguanylate cyclase (GGDEF)-like protein